MREPVKKVRVRENINPEILKRMKELGIASIPQLSERCGVNISTLYSGLGGRCELSFANAVRLAQALGWTSDYLAMIYLSENPFAKIRKNAATLISTEGTDEADTPIHQLPDVKSAQNLCNFYGDAA